MKKLRFAGITLALLFMSSSVFAIGLPKVSTGSSTVDDVVNTGVDMAKNKAIESEINKKIESRNCAFKSGATDTTCNLNDVINDIVMQKKVLETIGAVDKVYVDIVSHGPQKSDLVNDRDDHVYNTLYGKMSWWHYTHRRVKDDTDQLKISVTVK